MSVFQMQVRLGNDAMLVGDDVAELLRRVALQVEGPDEVLVGEGRVLADLNGNTVGSWSVVMEP